MEPEQKDENQSSPEKSRPILYYDIISPQARSCYILTKILGVDVDLKPLELVKGEHFSEEYNKVSPSGTVPTLEHGKLILYDSQTIMIYLCDQYSCGQLPPICPQKYIPRLELLNLLFYEGGILYRRHSQIMTDILLEKYENVDIEYYKRKVADCYNTLNKLLEDHTYMIGNCVTIADLSMVCTVSVMDLMFPIKKSLWPNLYLWLIDLKTMPWYEHNQIGVDKQRELLERVGHFPFPTPISMTNVRNLCPYTTEAATVTYSVKENIDTTVEINEKVAKNSTVKTSTVAITLPPKSELYSESKLTSEIVPNMLTTQISKFSMSLERKTSTKEKPVFTSRIYTPAELLYPKEPFNGDDVENNNEHNYKNDHNDNNRNKDKGTLTNNQKKNNKNNKDNYKKNNNKVSNDVRKYVRVESGHCRSYSDDCDCDNDDDDDVHDDHNDNCNCNHNEQQPSDNDDQNDNCNCDNYEVYCDCNSSDHDQSHDDDHYHDNRDNNNIDLDDFCDCKDNEKQCDNDDDNHDSCKCDETNDDHNNIDNNQSNEDDTCNCNDATQLQITEICQLMISEKDTVSCCPDNDVQTKDMQNGICDKVKNLLDSVFKITDECENNVEECYVVEAASEENECGCVNERKNNDNDDGNEAAGDDEGLKSVNCRNRSVGKQKLGSLGEKNGKGEECKVPKYSFVAFDCSFEKKGNMFEAQLTQLCTGSLPEERKEVNEIAESPDFREKANKTENGRRYKKDEPKQSENGVNNTTGNSVGSAFIKNKKENGFKKSDLVSKTDKNSVSNNVDEESVNEQNRPSNNRPSCINAMRAKCRNRLSSINKSPNRDVDYSADYGIAQDTKNTNDNSNGERTSLRSNGLKQSINEPRRSLNDRHDPANRTRSLSQNRKSLASPKNGDDNAAETNSVKESKNPQNGKSHRTSIGERTTGSNVRSKSMNETRSLNSNRKSLPGSKNDDNCSGADCDAKKNDRSSGRFKANALNGGSGGPNGKRKSVDKNSLNSDRGATNPSTKVLVNTLDKGIQTMEDNSNNNVNELEENCEEKNATNQQVTSENQDADCTENCKQNKGNQTSEDFVEDSKSNKENQNNEQNMLTSCKYSRESNCRKYGSIKKGDEEEKGGNLEQFDEIGSVRTNQVNQMTKKCPNIPNYTVICSCCNKSKKIKNINMIVNEAQNKANFVDEMTIVNQMNRSNGRDNYETMDEMNNYKNKYHNQNYGDYNQGQNNNRGYAENKMQAGVTENFGCSCCKGCGRHHNNFENCNEDESDEQYSGKQKNNLMTNTSNYVKVEANSVKMDRRKSGCDTEGIECCCNPKDDRLKSLQCPNRPKAPKCGCESYRELAQETPLTVPAVLFVRKQCPRREPKLKYIPQKKNCSCQQAKRGECVDGKIPIKICCDEYSNYNPVHKTNIIRSTNMYGCCMKRNCCDKKKCNDILKNGNYSESSERRRSGRASESSYSKSTTRDNCSEVASTRMDDDEDCITIYQKPLDDTCSTSLLTAKKKICTGQNCKCAPQNQPCDKKQKKYDDYGFLERPNDVCCEERSCGCGSSKDSNKKSPDNVKETCKNDYKDNCCPKPPSACPKNYPKTETRKKSSCPDDCANDNEVVSRDLCDKFTTKKSKKQSQRCDCDLCNGSPSRERKKRNVKADSCDTNNNNNMESSRRFFMGDDGCTYILQSQCPEMNASVLCPCEMCKKEQKAKNYNNGDRGYKYNHMYSEGSKKRTNCDSNLSSNKPSHFDGLCCPLEDDVSCQMKNKRISNSDRYSRDNDKNLYADDSSYACECQSMNYPTQNPRSIKSLLPKKTSGFDNTKLQQLCSCLEKLEDDCEEEEDEEEEESCTEIKDECCPKPKEAKCEEPSPKDKCQKKHERNSKSRSQSPCKQSSPVHNCSKSKPKSENNSSKNKNNYPKSDKNCNDKKSNGNDECQCQAARKSTQSSGSNGKEKSKSNGNEKRNSRDGSPKKKRKSCDICDNSKLDNKDNCDKPADDDKCSGKKNSNAEKKSCKCGIKESPPSLRSLNCQEKSKKKNDGEANTKQMCVINNPCNCSHCLEVRRQKGGKCLNLRRCNTAPNVTASNEDNDISNSGRSYSIPRQECCCSVPFCEHNTRAFNKKLPSSRVIKLERVDGDNFLDYNKLENDYKTVKVRILDENCNYEENYRNECLCCVCHLIEPKFSPNADEEDENDQNAISDNDYKNCNRRSNRGHQDRRSGVNDPSFSPICSYSGAREKNKGCLNRDNSLNRSKAGLDQLNESRQALLSLSKNPHKLITTYSKSPHRQRSRSNLDPRRYLYSHDRSHRKDYSLRKVDNMDHMAASYSRRTRKDDYNLNKMVYKDIDQNYYKIDQSKKDLKRRNRIDYYEPRKHHRESSRFKHTDFRTPSISHGKSHPVTSYNIPEPILMKKYTNDIVYTNYAVLTPVPSKRMLFNIKQESIRCSRCRPHRLRAGSSDSYLDQSSSDKEQDLNDINRSSSVPRRRTKHYENNIGFNTKQLNDKNDKIVNNKCIYCKKCGEYHCSDNTANTSHTVAMCKCENCLLRSVFQFDSVAHLCISNLDEKRSYTIKPVGSNNLLPANKTSTNNLVAINKNGEHNLVERKENNEITTNKLHIGGGADLQNVHPSDLIQQNEIIKASQLNVEVKMYSKMFSCVVQNYPSKYSRSKSESNSIFDKPNVFNRRSKSQPASSLKNDAMSGDRSNELTDNTKTNTSTVSLNTSRRKGGSERAKVAFQSKYNHNTKCPRNNLYSYNNLTKKKVEKETNESHTSKETPQYSTQSKDDIQDNVTDRSNKPVSPHKSNIPILKNRPIIKNSVEKLGGQATTTCNRATLNHHKSGIPVPKTKALIGTSEKCKSAIKTTNEMRVSRSPVVSGTKSKTLSKDNRATSRSRAPSSNRPDVQRATARTSTRCFSNRNPGGRATSRFVAPMMVQGKPPEIHSLDKPSLANRRSYKWRDAENRRLVAGTCLKLKPVSVLFGPVSTFRSWSPDPKRNSASALSSKGKSFKKIAYKVVLNRVRPGGKSRPVASSSTHSLQKKVANHNLVMKSSNSDEQKLSI